MGVRTHKRGKIAVEDIKFGAGTFSRATSTGGTQTLTEVSVSTLVPGVFGVDERGAAGDGTTDDAAIIQEAIDAAEAAGGGIVHLGPYTYLISTTLTIDSAKVSLRGVGPITVLKPSQLLTPMIYVGAASGTVVSNATSFVSDLTIDLDDTDSTGIYFRRNTGLRAENIMIVNPGADAVGIQAATSATVSGLFLRGINYYNVGAQGGGTDEGTAIIVDCNGVRIEDCRFYGYVNAVEIGSTTDALKGFVVTRCSFNGGSYGVIAGATGALGGMGCQVTQNSFAYHSNFDVQFYGKSTSRWYSPNINENVFTSSGGVELIYTTGAHVLGNTFRNFTTTTAGGRTCAVSDGAGKSLPNTNEEVVVLNNSLSWASSVVGTHISTVLPSTMARYDTHIQGALQVGTSTAADSPSSSNLGLYVSNSGVTGIAARDSTNNVEAALVANGAGGVKLGAVTSDHVRVVTGGTPRVLVHSDGEVYLYGPNSAPADASFSETTDSMLVFWIDESNHKLKVKVRYSDGTTYKAGEVALT